MYYWNIKLVYYAETTSVEYGMFEEILVTKVEPHEWSFSLCTKSSNPESAIRSKVWLSCPMVKRIKILSQTAITQDEFCKNLAE